MKAQLLTSAFRFRVLVLFAFLLMLATMVASICGTAGFDTEWVTLRIPRVLLGLITGASLAASGSALQSVFRNPLADPYILGVSGGAALGAALAIAVGDDLSSITIVAAAIFGASVASLPALFLARRKSGAHTILLVGLATNTLASALITVLKTAVPAEKSQSLLYWLVGNLGYPSIAQISLVLVICGLCLAYLFYHVGILELLRLPDDEAFRLGYDLKRFRLETIAVITVLIGVIVSLTGMIGFVGLVVPHLLRPFLGSDQRLLLPASALCGAMLLVLCDGASRLLFAVLHTELPTGTLTALIGAPFFIWILVRNDKHS